ncbi:MAG: glycosyltransferase [Candidatus Spechtbacterales bacterium]|nr:glycosyltransferase [Candidatus Spechtbacterales bacterium]
MSELSEKIKVSAGVFAHNEEKNIAKLLEALLQQQLNKVELDEIIIVASGCTDKTVEIAEQFQKQQNTNNKPQDTNIKILVQEKREGKVSAINLFLQEANNTTVLIESGDTIPAKNTVEYLMVPFENTKVGMTGARPVPIDKSHTLMGFATNLLWELHHRISLKTPKMGEMVAFRKDIIPRLSLTAVDEALIEAKIKKAGYEVHYVPEAIVYNKGPETAGDFLRQRRRIHAGHLHLKKHHGHAVSTGNVLTIFKMLGSMLYGMLRGNIRAFVYIPSTVALEATGKALGYWDFYVAKKDHIVWEQASSTKDLN